MDRSKWSHDQKVVYALAATDTIRHLGGHSGGSSRSRVDASNSLIRGGASSTDEARKAGFQSTNNTNTKKK